MRALIHAFAAAAVLAAAAPASALTVQAVPTSAPASARFSDPDAALESAGSNLRAAIAGGSSGDDARPAYLDAAPAVPESDGALYAADPVGFVMKAKGIAPLSGDAPSPQAPPQRR